MVLGLSQPDGDFVLPDPAPGAAAADQRRKRDHARARDAAHALRRGARRPVTFLHYTPHGRASTPTGAELERALAGSRPDVGSHVVGTRARPGPGGTPTSRAGSFAPSTADYLDAEVYVCGPPAPDRSDARDLGAGRRTSERVHSESFLPPPPSPAERRRRPGSLRAQRRRGRLPPARACSSRPSRPGSRPPTAAGWASATPAPPASSPDRCATSAAARSRARDAEDVQLCVSVPAGDVELDL